jgi:putative nucleotidyltransferase with HDIG domain
MKLPPKVKIYIYLVIGFAVAALVLLFQQHQDQPILWRDLIFWAILAILTESLVLKLPSGMGLSVGLAVSLAALLSHGPFVATIVTGCSFLFRVISIGAKGKVAHLLNTSPYKTLFNTAQGILSIGVAGMVFTLLGGKAGQFNVFLAVQVVFLYTVLNSMIMSAFFSLLKGEPFFRTWFGNMRGLLFNLIFVGMMGVILFLAYNSYGIGAVLLFLGPLLLARFSFKQYTDLRETYVETIKAFNKFTEAKDVYTGEHSTRVEIYAVELAKSMGFNEQRVENVRMAAILHDIGKIGISDNIIKKQSGLDRAEYEQIKLHPGIGADILQNVHFLKDVSNIIRQHHEKFDGTGYPKGLKGEEICTESAILALADVYDAITSNRSYRKPLSYEEAQHEIAVNAGTQFNPQIARKFLELVKSKPEVFDRNAV